MAFSKTIATCRDRRGWERYLRENGYVAQDGYRVIGSRVCWHGFANNGVGSWRRWWRRGPRRRWRHGRRRFPRRWHGRWRFPWWRLWWWRLPWWHGRRIP